MAEPVSSPLVDYAAAAPRYDQGRALADDVLNRWRDALAAQIGPIQGLRVVDVGAGTGIFAEAWREWGAERVVAVEPSAAMRMQAATRSVGRFWIVGGAAERLPVRDGVADIVWLSAVVHHLRDRAAAATEIRRVLRPGGHLLVRGHFPGTSTIPWLAHAPAPAMDRANGRFPSADELVTWFAPSGLTLAGVATVTERPTITAAAAAAWIDQMRGADSILTAMTDDELDAVSAALRNLGTTDLGPDALGLVALRAGDPSPTVTS